MGKEPGELLEELKNRILDYTGMRIELLKLNAYERIAKLIAILSQSLVLMILMVFGILFAFLTLAFFLGELWHRTSLGFLAVFGIYLLLAVIMLVMKKSIRTHVMNTVIKTIFEKEEENNDHEY
ncbi:MAG: phage holin family protein [Culturomica sp.]|jgi:uncharacterized membrane protein YagU involved in acid resistance|nr:phage holin family protein [Culturomica sp.]